MSAARDEFLAKVKRQVQRAVDAGVRIGKSGGRPGDDAEVIAICVAALAEEYAATLAEAVLPGSAPRC
jgi:hypothetical protein